MKTKKYEPHIPPEITIRVKDNTQKTPYYLQLDQNGWAINNRNQAYRYHDIQLDGNKLDIYMEDTTIYKNHKPHKEEPSATKTYTIQQNTKDTKTLKRWISNQNKLSQITLQKGVADEDTLFTQTLP